MTTSSANPDTPPLPELSPELVRAAMEVDIACVGFGPATGGFLTALTQAWQQNPADPAFESKVMPGMPLQVLCYERADDIAAGVSGVVTRAKGIRASLPDLNVTEIPMATEISEEKVFYLLDPLGASTRSFAVRSIDWLLRALRPLGILRDHAFQLPWIPPFLNKHGGLILSIGQFNQWVGAQLMASGLVQIWPGSPVAAPLISQGKVEGIRLSDQGVDRTGAPESGFMPGMDVRALLTVIGDGPVGAVSQAVDEQFGMPTGNARREWALGMKMVIELPENSTLKPGTVWHTFGFPEPEIFGFMYVHPERLVSVGIFIPSSLNDSSRTAYRYLQHYIQHPMLWLHLKDGTLRSWGAKSLEESGKHGEPFLSGDGYARIGEDSGSTNMLTGSGVDEAWITGTQLAEAVLELLRAGKPFTRENLRATYEIRRRASWVERGAREAENARSGFHRGLLRGMTGMALAGLTGGKISLGGEPRPPRRKDSGIPDLKFNELAQAAQSGVRSLHDSLLTARGWPEIQFDGRLLVTQQDALLMGGKVQAMPGFADHVLFRSHELCIECVEKSCIAMCSGQAITDSPSGIPNFEREKCLHCGACLWNCHRSPDGIHSNVEFRAGAGGLHSAEN